MSIPDTYTAITVAAITRGRNVRNNSDETESPESSRRGGVFLLTEAVNAIPNERKAAEVVAANGMVPLEYIKGVP